MTPDMAASIAARERYLAQLRLRESMLPDLRTLREVAYVNGVIVRLVGAIEAEARMFVPEKETRA